MGALIPIPAGEPHPFSEEEPFVFRSAGKVWFVLARHRAHRLIFDVSGATRVDAAAVQGGAMTVPDGALITAGAVRLRLTEGDSQVIAARCEAATLCSYCREMVEAGEPGVRCPKCGRIQHAECARVSAACGRCQKPLQLEKQ